MLSSLIYSSCCIQKSILKQDNSCDDMFDKEVRRNCYRRKNGNNGHQKHSIKRFFSLKCVHMVPTWQRPGRLMLWLGTEWCHSLHYHWMGYCTRSYSLFMLLNLGPVFFFKSMLMKYEVAVERSAPLLMCTQTNLQSTSSRACREFGCWRRGNLEISLTHCLPDSTKPRANMSQASTKFIQHTAIACMCYCKNGVSWKRESF